MKKIVTVLLLSLGITSCGSKNQEGVVEITEESPKVMVYKYEVSGHQYQAHIVRTTKMGFTQVFHSPDCPCKNKDYEICE